MNCSRALRRAGALFAYFSDRVFVRLAASIAIAVTAIAGASPVQARTYKTIYSFPMATGTNFYGPQTGLFIDQKSGVIYGTASDGGSGAGGVVFSLTPPKAPSILWTITKLYDFGNASDDGKAPAGRLVGLAGDTLIGTTIDGPGLVYRLSPPVAPNTMWTETLLHVNGCCGDPVSPYDGVLYDVKGLAGTRGAYYGVTNQGGTSSNCYGGCGAVYMLSRVSKAWKLTIIHSFAGSKQGWTPTYTVEMDNKGVLYGEAGNGGPDGMGLIYSLTPPVPPKTGWTYAILHNFTLSNGEGHPISPLLFYKGELYGSSSIGYVGGPGGTLFKLTPPVAPKKAWTKTNLYTFTGSNGDGPNGKLLVDKSGALWGTTFSGGAKNCGTVYKMSPPAGSKKTWTYTLIHSFNDKPDGCNPTNYGLATDASGKIYGATNSGGAKGNGSIFMIVP